MSLTVVPISIKDANILVERHHRHHGKVLSALFAVAVADGEDIVGTALVGRPVARMLQDGWTVEVTRCVTWGAENACSALYAAAWRVARAMGYRKIITYTLKQESGVSLTAAGWKTIAKVKGRSWDCLSRPRIDKYPLLDKVRWQQVGEK